MSVDIKEFYVSIGADAVIVPEEVRSFPSMMTAGEKELLYLLGRLHYKGAGIIVDAGLFLGASTNAFAIGIKDNPALQAAAEPQGFAPIHAFEIAIWNARGFDKYLDNPLVQKALEGFAFSDGDSYLPALKRILAPHLGLIEFKIGNIELTAQADAPVEIAFYDCLKNYERDLAAFTAFAPHYIPNHTIVVQQDYFYEDAIESRIRQELLSPHFRFLGSAGTSAVFQLMEPIPPEFFHDDPVKALSVEESVRLLERAAERIPPSAHRIYTELSAVFFLLRHNRVDEAAKRLSDIEQRMRSMKLPPRPGLLTQHARSVLEGKAATRR